MDPRHIGRDSHPPREEAQGASHSGGYPRHPAQDGPKGPRTPSGKTLLYAPRGARGSGPPLPHSACTESGGSVPGMDIARLSLGARQLESACPPSSVPTDSSGRNLFIESPPIWDFVAHRASEREACGSTRPGQVIIWSGDFLGPPPDIVASLVSWTNPQGTIANSDLVLTALILQEATLLKAVPKARIEIIRGSSWGTKK